MKSVFADAFYWIASINPQDTWHQQVIDWTYVNSDTHIMTTEEVLSEFLAFYSKRGQGVRNTALKVVRHLQQRQDIKVIPQSHDSFSDGLALFESRPDKGYSLTDCISMNVMLQHNITQALTHDHHFIQEGFEIIFE